MSLHLIDDCNVSLWAERIKELEASAEYPIGEDMFRIDHGSDYFAFFRRLGRLRYYAWLEGDRLAAVGAAVLRKISETKVRAWYLSDLKVHPDFRGQGLPLKIVGRAFLGNYLRCSRAYAISMNTPGQDFNRIERLISRFRWARSSEACKLQIWSLDFDTMHSVAPTIELYRGPLSYLSLLGIKDLILRSTGAPLPLLHVQFGPAAARVSGGLLSEAQAGFSHMFCSPAGDPLDLALQSLGLQATASATVITHRMANSDWSWVLTSDI